MLCRQQPGSVNISRLHWAKGNLLKIICPLLPAAVSCRTQPPAPNSAVHGRRPQRGPCTLRRAGGCGGSRIRISGTCAFPSPAARTLVLCVTHARSGGGLRTSPTGWTHRGCSASHPRGSLLTSLVPRLWPTAKESEMETVPTPPARARGRTELGMEHVPSCNRNRASRKL